MSAHDILMGAAGGTSLAANYVEDVFSTYLYTGNGSTQTITNGIDLSGKGGLTWIKSRTVSNLHNLVDTNRGANLALDSSTTLANWNTASGGVTSFNSNGFSLGNFGSFNGSGTTFASWTFRKQPKFFDVVTYTGNSTARTIAHNLGSVPGCIILKRTDAAGDWYVYHRSADADAKRARLFLNLTNEVEPSITTWNETAPTSTVFSVNDGNQANATGGTYVAYLFAHNAGGFGLTGTDNVISCGSFTANGGGSDLDINLGYEPQFLIMKNASVAGGWIMLDTMRGLNVGQSINLLYANASSTEQVESGQRYFGIYQSGFRTLVNSGGFGFAAGNQIIYIAIRRGPMKVPTSGTSVFAPIYSAAAANTVLTTSFPVDLQIPAYTGGTIGRFVVDRLRGVVTTAVDAATSPWMKTNSTDAETTGFNITRAWDNTGYQIPQYLGGATTVYFNFRRAPGFFDEVCYTGTGVARTVAHNLAAVPELMIVKSRSTSARSWIVYAQALGATKGFYLEEPDAAVVSSGFWNNTAPTSSVFTVNTNSSVNGSGSTFVAYLFATVAGVSKVGSYTGTGTTQVINCGFTAGARFVLIKRTDAPGGDWYVWDSARGIVAGNDPYLLLNTTAAEVTSTDYVDPVSSGFEISSTAPAAINASGGSFIYLSIA